MSRPLQVCTKCILDTNDDPQIEFDSNGVCNYCRHYERALYKNKLSPEEKARQLEQVVSRIKAEGKGKEYDCVMGISGGVDSTYMAYMAKQLGLRPLVVHYDNGWNSELAVKNIEGIVQKLGFDLFTYVNDWEEFKDLQLSFFKASVIDIELLTDQAIIAVLMKQARDKKVRHILFGNNNATESVLPKSWYHWKIDVLNIEAIHQKFGSVRLRTYPRIGFFERAYYNKFIKTESVFLLDLLDYVKEDAKKLIAEKLGWRDYGGKHYESIFTRFYQAYYLPKKFGIDKRKAHLTSLICSGQLTREEALEQMRLPVYDPQKLQEDKEYVIKKLGLTAHEFEALMQLPPKQHTDYPSYLTSHYRTQEKLSRIYHSFKRGLGLEK